MDLADLAQKETDGFIQESANKRRESDRLLPIGVCYNCDEHITDGKVFCSAECAEDYRRRDQARSKH